MARSTGCRCPQCHSLKEFMEQLTGRDYGLAAAPGHAPHVPAEEACTRRYDCRCTSCRETRVHLVKAGGQAARQPWDPIPISQRAA